MAGCIAVDARYSNLNNDQSISAIRVDVADVKAEQSETSMHAFPKTRSKK